MGRYLTKTFETGRYRQAPASENSNKERNYKL